MNPIFILVVAATAVWIYFDATKNKIGKTEKGGLFNLSAGAWAVCNLLLWIIAFPAYLIKRSSLKTIAGEHPVEVKGRGIKEFINGFSR